MRRFTSLACLTVSTPSLDVVTEGRPPRVSIPCSGEGGLQGEVPTRQSMVTTCVLYELNEGLRHYELVAERTWLPEVSREVGSVEWLAVYGVM